MFRSLIEILKNSLKDNATGCYSHSRIIAMLVALAATVFMWKLILLGGMNIDYFIAYLTYGTGSASLNKLLDIKDGARSAQAQANIDNSKTSDTKKTET